MLGMAPQVACSEFGVRDVVLGFMKTPEQIPVDFEDPSAFNCLVCMAPCLKVWHLDIFVCICHRLLF